MDNPMTSILVNKSIMILNQIEFKITLRNDKFVRKLQKSIVQMVDKKGASNYKDECKFK